METWRHGDMETWRHGDMETWRHGDMAITTRRLIEGAVWKARSAGWPNVRMMRGSVSRRSSYFLPFLFQFLILNLTFSIWLTALSCRARS